MRPQQFGDYTVRKLVEVVEPFAPAFTFHDWDDAALREHAAWLAPHFVAGAGDALTLTFSFHTYVVQGFGKTILIDTCVGNHKDRAALPFWHMQNRPYLDNLRAMGIAPEEVDYVMCTHLHADHVGWNTRLQDGRWVPTFPNARYIFSKGDYDHYNTVKPGEFGYTSLADSVFPIVDAGLAEIVSMDFAIGDGLSLVPSPGHTPGHYCVHLQSDGVEAFFTGDMLHHPVLIAEPQWKTKFCLDPERSTATRRAFIAAHAGGSAIVLAAHFAGPTAGRIIDVGGAPRFAMLDGA
ncbi:MAG: MBL fold metallo-hydrolase [Proteobacteria bacterium]|nr:MBL fold metallo-hydrolase [Pseudomonadota bacterium]MDA1058123.1 MBL fold metallo-hydrolase [Pseudomonadota bacterium]